MQSQFRRLGAFVLSLMLALVVAGGASAATRILTLTTLPAGTLLSAVYFNGVPVPILSYTGDYTFARVDDGGAGFQCQNLIAVTTVTGRTVSQQVDTCAQNWQANFDLRDSGAGPSVRRVAMTPANPDVRILTLALDGVAQPFTAYPATNRIEFDIRRTPSGFVCARNVQALLSNGRSYASQVDLCGNNFEVIIDDAPVSYFEILSVRTTSADRIVAVSINGADQSIYSSMPDGVRVRVLAGPSGIVCQAAVTARFASGSVASRTLNMCDANWQVVLNPTRVFDTDRNYGSPRTWQHIPSNDAGVPARLIYVAAGRQPAFEARCLPGTGNASLYLSGFVSGTVTTPRPRLALDAGNFRSTLDGRLDTLPGTSVTGIPAVNLATSSGLWNGLISGSQFIAIANDRHRVVYALNASAAPVRAFVANCNTRPVAFGPGVIGDVTSDNSLTWIFTPGAPGRSPRLVYGNIASDRIGFEAVCSPGSGQTEASFLSVPPGLPAGQNAGIGWDIGTRSGTVAARTQARNGIAWGAIAFSRIGWDHSFYSGVIAGSTIRITYNGVPVAVWSLRGSGVATRAFLDACRPQFGFPGIPGGPGGPGVPGGPGGGANQALAEIFASIQAPTGGGPVGGPDPAAAALAAYRAQPNVACGLERSLVRPGPQPVEAVFTNQRNQPVRLFTLDNFGNRVFVSTIGPGGTQILPSRVNQGWIVTDVVGQCITAFASPRSRTELAIRPGMEQADPSAYALSYVCGSDPIAIVVEPSRGKATLAGQFALQLVRDGSGERYLWGTAGMFVEEMALRIVNDGVPRLICDAVAG